MKNFYFEAEAFLKNEKVIKNYQIDELIASPKSITTRSRYFLAEDQCLSALEAELIRISKDLSDIIHLAAENPILFSGVEKESLPDHEVKIWSDDVLKIFYIVDQESSEALYKFTLKAEEDTMIYPAHLVEEYPILQNSLSNYFN